MNSPRTSDSFEDGGPVSGAEGGADRSEERRIGSPADGGTSGLQITQKRRGHREENDGASALANTATGKPHTWLIFGAMPADCTLTAPESAFDTWEGGPWQLDEAARLAAARDMATRKRALVLQYASTKVAALQDAVDLQIASDTEVLAVKSWKTYRILLNRVDSIGAGLAEGDWPTCSDPAATDRYLSTNG